MNNYQAPYQDPNQQPYQDPNQQPFQAPKKQPSGPNALIALILGIVAMACPLFSLPACCSYEFWFFSIFPVFGLGAGVAGLVLSILAKNKGANAIVGMILSIVGLVLNLVLFFTCTLCTGCAGCAVASGASAFDDAFGSGAFDSIMDLY